VSGVRRTFKIGVIMMDPLMAYFLLLIGMGEEYGGWVILGMATLVAAFMAFRIYVTKKDEPPL